MLQLHQPAITDALLVRMWRCVLIKSQKRHWHDAALLNVIRVSMGSLPFSEENANIVNHPIYNIALAFHIFELLTNFAYCGSGTVQGTKRKSLSMKPQVSSSC